MKNNSGSRRTGRGPGHPGHGASFEGRAHRDDRGRGPHDDHDWGHAHRGPARRGGGRGMGMPGGRRGPRARRGDLRLSVLYLLGERPMHGYELMSEISDRTGGVWQPSPGSMYPTLSLLEDEGLIGAEGEGAPAGPSPSPRRGARPPRPPTDRSPWADVVNASDPALEELRQDAALGPGGRGAGGRGRLRRGPGPHQSLLVDLRRELYLMLAGGPEHGPAGRGLPGARPGEVPVDISARPGDSREMYGDKVGISNTSLTWGDGQRKLSPVRETEAPPEAGGGDEEPQGTAPDRVRPRAAREGRKARPASRRSGRVTTEAARPECGPGRGTEGTGRKARLRRSMGP